MTTPWSWPLGLSIHALMATPCAAAEFGDDFANNLISDLAPILALFGERVTMQFLSQSTGWSDVIILAMAPLGIVTIIVSAIRLGGPSWLKAAIGRARENLAVAEIDLMSSTSTEVCELWNGHEIVRSLGSAPVREFICISPTAASDTVGSSDRIGGNLRGGMKEYIQMASDEEPSQSLTTWYPLIHRRPQCVVAREKRTGAPNIALNLHQHNRQEVRTAALLGIFLQATVLVYAGFATYHPALSFPKEQNEAVASYAYPCFATGTFCLVMGLMLCGHVVESSTEERTTRMAGGYKAHHIWLQRKATVGDQIFGSFAIFSGEPLDTIVTSRRTTSYEPTIIDRVLLAVPGYLLKLLKGKIVRKAGRKMHQRQESTALLASKTIIGTLSSLCGFTVQFIGLRGAHWSISVCQLAAVLIMTLTRVYVRRNFARPPLCLQLPANFELDWFAMSLMDKDPAIWLHGSNHTTKSTETNSFDDKEPENGSDCPTSIPSLRVITANVSESGGLKSQMPSEQSRAHQLVLIRNQLGDLAGWRSVVHPDARILKRAIDITLEALADYYPRGTWIWGFETEFNGEGSQEVHFEVTGSKIGLTAGLLEAVLSLWVYSIDQQRRDFRQRHFADAYLPWARGADDGEDGTGDEWYNVDFRHSEQHLRSLGYTSRQLQRDLHWWVPLGGESFNAIWVESVGTPRGDSRVCDRTRAGGSGLDIPWLDEEGHAEVPIIFYASPSESKGPVFDVNDANSQANGLISSRVSGTPKSFYAQELFSSFMWTLAKTMTVRIGGTTDVQLSAVPSDNPLESFTLSNKILSALINDIHNTGLASLETTFSLVIPPLSAVNKLPDATAVIELARHEANPYEQRGNLFEAGKIYVWLARAMRTFPSESEVRAKAIAVFVQHAKHVQEVMDYWRRCVGLHDAMSFVALQTHQEMIREELKGDEIREALMELYDYRNHLTKSEGIAWSQGAPEEKLPSTLGFTKTHAFAKQPRAPYDLSSHLSHINLPDVFGRTPIHYAATTAESSIMQVVRNIKGLVDVADLGGKTPLHYACEAAGAGTDKIVRSLIEAGAELDRQARDGTRPIHCAAASGAEKTLRILAEAGATVDVLDATGKSPLMLAALGGHHGAVEYLSLISNQSLRDAHGRNVLHMAVASGNLEVVRLFAEEKHYSHDRNGHTPLNIAAYVGDADMVRFLIGKFNTKDEFVSPKTSLTPLHSAISAGQADIVNMLIREYDVDKNTADGAGWLPLHCAAWAGRYDMVRLLIEEYSANKEVKTRLDWTPLFVAIEMDRGLELVRPLIEEFGCDVNTRDRQQQTLLHVAARRKDTGLARYFLEKQCIDVDARDENGRTPLFTAVRMQHEDMARMLVLEFGADVNARDTQGKTPLHNAMESRNDPSSIAEALLRELGADMHALDEKDTPLHVPNSI